jgi:hypothetical protein
MNYLILVFLIIFSSCSNISRVNKKCYPYDKVEIVGKIEVRINKDSGGKYWILSTEPFCTFIEKDEQLYEAFSNETEIHLVIDDYKDNQQYINQKVVVYGELYSKHTGHHHRNVLLIVDKIVGDK